MLISIPGIAEITAAKLLAEIPHLTELPPDKNTICQTKAHVASTIAVFSFDSIHGHKKDILTPIWRAQYNKIT